LPITELHDDERHIRIRKFTFESKKWQAQRSNQAPNFDATTNPFSFGRSQVNLSALQLEIAEINSILRYHSNEYDETRRTYIQKRPLLTSKSCIQDTTIVCMTLRGQLP